MNASPIDGKWSLGVCGLPVSASSPALEAMDHTTSVNKLQGLLKRIEAMNICEGNDDDRFVSLASISKWIQQRLHHVPNNPEKPTVRHLNYHVLTIPPAKRCQQCRSMRVSLRVLTTRQQQASRKQKYTRNTYLPTPLHLAKLSKVGKNLKATQYERYGYCKVASGEAEY